MNVWLCPVKRKSWRLISRYNVFGAPRNARKIMKQVKAGDLLVFHILRPTNGIVAICRVVSDFYEDNKDIWGKYQYPLRVKLETVRDFLKEAREPLPLSCVYGGNSHSNFVVEPFLKNVWITKIGENQYRNLKLSRVDPD